mmetsp:Transcript_75371/g.151549  ORF Transcript_75371/g.151549 Transcript_75371/m.151549 type:complete len:211 (+) Transcript_75371:151-783(+)
MERLGSSESSRIEAEADAGRAKSEATALEAKKKKLVKELEGEKEKLKSNDKALKIARTEEAASQLRYDEEREQLLRDGKASEDKLEALTAQLTRDRSHVKDLEREREKLNFENAELYVQITELNASLKQATEKLTRVEKIKGDLQNDINFKDKELRKKQDALDSSVVKATAAENKEKRLQNQLSSSKEQLNSKNNEIETKEAEFKKPTTS